MTEPKFTDISGITTIFVGLVLGYIAQDWLFYASRGSRILFWLSKAVGHSSTYFFFQHIWGWPFK